jgi:cytochrome d ubiquinol oxidase subunit II
MESLQILWFILWATLWSVYFTLDGFDLGSGILMNFIAKKEKEKTAIINSIGPFWDGNEVWLITAGGATFAAFPQAYAKMFSWFYIPTFLILISLILRVVSEELRSKV